MKLSFFVAGALALFSTSSLVSADSLQDQIDAATKNFCGGIQVTAPATNAVYADPTKVSVTVTRVPNTQAKIVNAVDVYSINAKGQPQYLGTAWRGTYKLETVATLSVDITKIKGLKYPSQFEFRVWVHNQAGPDCTLMSKVFSVKSGSHTNAAEEDQAVAALDTNINRGCFGVDITSPATGEHKKASDVFSVQIQRDSASPVDEYTSLTLYKVDIATRESVKVEDTWTGKEVVHAMFNLKATLPAVGGAVGAAPTYAYYYKLSSTTQHQEVCEFFSHPFYIDA
ncbi:hypothetical protein BDF14DRAFT_1873333 [Spinellus fusiger]|nr:hypothetical protein BDF14DRAFT_1873333 [Spinellus fusiger]